VKPAHAFEAALARGAFAALDRLSWPRALGAGAALGDLVRVLGVRRRVAAANLALAFPEKSAQERERILVGHYRELGRIAAEYGRMPRLTHAPGDEVVARVDGLDALESLRGRGAVLLTGHLGNFEMLGAWLARFNPVDFLVKPLSNPAVEETIARLRREAGAGTIPLGAGVKGVYRALRAGRWVALVADQDQRRHGVFVPFFGRLASTAEGPARLSLQLGAPIVFGAIRRQPDGRHHLRMDPPREPQGPASDANVLALTAWHAARLEQRIRESPEEWFWLHRRWKTPPPNDTKPAGDAHAPL
jgi:KDO2-lipid IV(A) lauroyltransferase